MAYLLTDSGHARVMIAVMRLCVSVYKRQKVSPGLFNPESPPRFDPSCRTADCNTVLLELCNGLPVRIFSHCGNLTLFDDAVARALPAPVDDRVTVPLFEQLDLYPIECQGGNYTVLQIMEIGRESIGLPRLEPLSELLEGVPAQEHAAAQVVWCKEMERLTVNHTLFDVPVRACLLAMLVERNAKRYGQCYDLAYLALQKKGVTDPKTLTDVPNACMFSEVEAYMPTFYRLMWQETIIYAKAHLQ